MFIIDWLDRFLPIADCKCHIKSIFIDAIQFKIHYDSDEN